MLLALRRASWVFAIAILLSCSSHAALSQGDSLLFAYGVYTNTRIEIHVFDPFAADSGTTAGTIPIANDERLQDVFVAQHGRSLVALLTRQDSIILRQLNLAAGEVSSLTLQDAMIPPPRETPNRLVKTAVLSSDTRYLAVHVILLNGNQGVLILDTAAHTLAVNTTPDQAISTLVWANTSPELAAAVRHCSTVTCESRLDLFHPDAVVGDSIVVSPTIGFGDDTCNLLWSPSDTYISFLQTCDGSFLGSAREAYVVNRATGAVQQATAFTPTDVLPSESTFNGTYESVWTSPTTLLISGYFHYGRLIAKDGLITGSTDDGESITTMQYDLDLQAARALDATRRDYFSPSGHGLMAYVAYRYSAEVPTDAAVEVSSAVKLGDSPFFAGVSGCGVMWDADGLRFAYTLADRLTISGFCSGGSLQFVGVSDNAAIQFDLPNYAFPIGWLS